MKTSIKIIALSLFFMLQVDGVGATCTVQTEGSNKFYTFLIEGCNAMEDDGTCDLPELVLASDLAKQMNASVIDCIHSYDFEHLSAFILGRPHKNPPLTLDEQKLFASVELSKFYGHSSIDAIINHSIKEPYKQMKEKGLIKAVPDWVNDLNSSTYVSFMEEAMNKFGGNNAAFSAAINNLASRSLAISNDVSKDSLLDYLSKNPDVKTVRGLIGKRHLPFLDSAGRIARSTDTHQHIELNHNSHKVDVFLYGGTHGEDEHFIALKSDVEAEQGKTFECKKPKDDTAEFIRALLQIVAKEKSESKFQEDVGDDSHIRALDKKK